LVFVNSLQTFKELYALATVLQIPAGRELSDKLPTKYFRHFFHLQNVLLVLPFQTE